MQIKQITDENFKDKWNNFVIESSSPASFLQSWEWGEFKEKGEKEKCGNNLFRFAIYQEDELISVALFVKRTLPNKKFYLNCAKGPIIKFSIFNFQFSNNDKISKIFKLLIQEIKNISKKEKIIFFRIAPPYCNNFQFSIFNFKFPKILTNLKEPENTLILNLERSEDEILKSMRQKTRYNIRLSEKKEIIIKQEKNIDIFYNLIKQTAERDKINIFNKNYYENLLNYFNKNKIINHKSLILNLFFAEHKNQPLSSIIVVGFGNTATYFYGASSNEKRNLMPNYLIQWEAIKWAKKNNYKYYDFWGIESETTKNWTGITKFKKGFVKEQTGKEINFVGSFDYILNKKWYNLFKLGKIFNKFLNF